MVSLIWTIVVVLFVLWLVFFALKIGGALIWLLLVLAGAGIVYKLLVGGRTGLCGNFPPLGGTTGGGFPRGSAPLIPGGCSGLGPDFCVEPLPILIALGGYLLISTLGLLRGFRGDLFWPILLIAIGLLVLVRRR